MPTEISFIVPAYNEALEIGKTLSAIQDAARATGRPFEIIVVNDASTDATAEIARAAGARVVDVKRRQISAVRNDGAKEAAGSFLFFVDADTLINRAVLAAALAALSAGAAGGGADVIFEERVPWRIRAALAVFTHIYGRLLRWAAGCFFFARKDAFEAAGRFDETLFATEEIPLSIALKKQGRFVVLREPVATSARKLRMYSSWRIVPLLARMAVQGPAFFRQRKGLEWWYEGRREESSQKTDVRRQK